MSNKLSELNNLDHQKLSRKLVENLNNYLEHNKLNNAEFAQLSGIPHSTIYAASSATSVNPRLYTLFDLANFLKVNISQLVGQIPYSLQEIAVPVINWANIDVKTNQINIDVFKNTIFVSCSVFSPNRLFALETDLTNEFLGKNNTIIVEETNIAKNNDLIILSINKSPPIIKRFIIDGQEIYLDSLSQNLPIQKFNKEISSIFGVIRETKKIF
jgi:SOS-response transcriptional repressor LexA